MSAPDGVSDDELPWPDPAPFLREALARASSGPERIGPFEILGPLGQGGMGVVYRARQLHPAREVALKVLHPGRSDPAFTRRFEREIEALGRLEHRGIARLYEAGDDSVGGASGPYFAMELVDGVPITEFAVARELDVRGRLRLLAAVCDAVGYANARGIVHRDLKPANVLVTSAGEPKVLDFGIALVVTGASARTSLRTEAGQVLGTIAYMSPEQVLGDPTRVDAQADVYALGAIGYELLTGRLPLDVRHRTLADAAGVIRDQDPLPVSALDRTLAGDVEAMLATALSKEKERRYGSVAALGADLMRFLHDEPVLARSPTISDVARRLARRHRAAAVSIGAVLLILAGATAVSVRFALGEARQRRLAELRAEQTERVTRFQSDMLRGIDVEAMGRGILARTREQVAAALARNPIGAWPERRERTAAEVDLALAAFDDLVIGAEGADVARRVLDDYVLGPAAQTLDERRADDPPLVRAQLHVAVAGGYQALGMFDDAARHFRVALELHVAASGREHADVADVMNALATTLQEGGDPAAAALLFEEALGISRRLRGPDHPDTLTVLCNLAGSYDSRTERGRAEPLFRQALALARSRFGDEHRLVAGVLANLGVLLYEKRDLAGAEAAYREAVAIRRATEGGNELELATILTNLATLLIHTGRADEAVSMMEDSLSLHEARLGHEHPRTYQVLRGFATALRVAGRLDEAEAVMRRALALRRRLDGDEDLEVARSLCELAQLHLARGDPGGAGSLLREASGVVRACVDAAPSEQGRVLADIAALLHHGRDYEAAARLHREALDVLRVALGDDDLSLARTGNNLASTLRATGDAEGAEAAYREALRIMRAGGEGELSLGIATSGLANVLADQGRYAAAELSYREALALLRQEPDATGDQIPMTQASLAATLVALDRYAEAEAMLREARAAQQEGRGRTARSVTAVLAGLVALHERWEVAEPNRGHAARAEEWRVRLDDLRSGAGPGDTSTDP